MLLVSSVILYAQPTLPPCAPTTGTGCTQWTSRTFTHVVTDGLGVSITVTVWTRVCNGVTEFIYDNATVVPRDNGKFMEDFSIYHHNFSAIRELLDMHLIEWAVNDLNATIPDCPSQTNLVKFYQANCGVWVKCSYKIDPASEQKDIGYEGNCPRYTLNGEDWVDVWKWQSCGTACCKKTYSVCRGTSPETGEYTIRILNVLKNREGACTMQGQFKDWRTNNDIPCQDGC